MFARTTADYWRDLGTPLAFVHGSADLVTGRAPSPLVGPPAEALIHPTAVVDPTARVTGGSSIGPYAVVGAHAVVDRSIIGGNVTVAEGAQVHESVVDHDSSIGSESVLHEVVVGCHSKVGAQNELPARLRLSCGIRIPAQAVRRHRRAGRLPDAPLKPYGSPGARCPRPPQCTSPRTRLA